MLIKLSIAKCYSLIKFPFKFYHRRSHVWNLNKIRNKPVLVRIIFTYNIGSNRARCKEVRPSKCCHRTISAAKQVVAKLHDNGCIGNALQVLAT